MEQISPAPPQPVQPSPTAVPEWQCTWRSGPDAGGTHPLPVGRHLVGRAVTTDVRCDDRLLEPHHLIVEVGDDGVVVITQLTGRAPVRVNGVAIDEITRIGDGDSIEIGSSVLQLHRRASSAGAAVVHDGSLIRSPRARSAWTPADLTPPAARSPQTDRPGGLVPAMLGLGGAGLIALVLRQPMFLLFGALGGLVAVGSWSTQWLASRRRAKRDRETSIAEHSAYAAALCADRSAFEHHHRHRVPTLTSARHDICAPTTALWARRGNHPDAFVVSVGIGDQPWRLAPPRHAYDTAELTMVGDLPVPVDLGAGARLAVNGPAAMATVRSLVVQLAASCGPADLRIVIVTDDPRSWDSLRPLPHLALPDGSPAVVGEHEVADTLEQLATAVPAHLVVVTDSHRALATRTGPLRRALGGEPSDGRDCGLIAALPTDAGVPHLCTGVLTTGRGPIGRWVEDTTTTLLPVPVRVVGLGERSAAQCAVALRDLTDPEDPLTSSGRIPRAVTLGSLLDPSGKVPGPDAIAAVWEQVGVDPTPNTPFGMAADGIVDLDLCRDGPHGLIAGTTGSGKSELLRTLVAGMAARTDPAHLTFVLVDYKGGATFDACSELPHVVGVVTDLDDHLADRALRSLHAELRRREAILREHGASDLSALRAIAPSVLMPRLVVVIDEFAALVAEQPAFLHALVGIAQRGRSLGVHLLLATQRPNGVISDDIRANTNLRLALRLHDVADAIDVVGDRGPAQLPRGLPGRAVLRLGADEHLTFQTAHCTATEDGKGSELSQLVRAVREAALLSGSPTPPPPWLPPLTNRLTPEELPAGALGWCDDPDRQRFVPLKWDPEDGWMIVAGSAGAGVGANLQTLALHALTLPDVHVYVLHARSAERFAGIADHPRGEVVHLHERERVVRLLHLLGDRGPAQDAPIVFVVDHLDTIRRALDGIDTAGEHETLDDLLTDATRIGLTVVAGVEQPSALPAAFLSRCPNRWVMHLHDPHDGGALGVAAVAVPPPVPGRIRVAATALTGQIVEPRLRPSDHHGECTERRTLPRIDVLPASAILPSDIRGFHRAATTHVPLGIDFTTGTPFVLEVADGDHVLVLGGARTGRSTTLARFTEAWRDAHPLGRIIAFLPRRSPLDRHHAHVIHRGNLDDDWRRSLAAVADVPTLLVVDDAELVDDPGGALAAFAGSADPHRTVVAAAHPDALRQTYGHWTAVLRRSRLGVISTGGADTDGDLLGIVLPRRTPIAPRPGLVWIADNGTRHLVQIAGASSSISPGADCASPTPPPGCDHSLRAVGTGAHSVPSRFAR